MPSNILIINPGFPEWKYEFVKSLKELGNPCLAISLNNSQLPIEDFKWIYKTNLEGNNEQKYAQLKKAVKFLEEKLGNIQFIESFEEYWKPFEGKLREEFNIEGRTLNEYNLISSKQKTKETFLKSGAKVAKSLIPKSLNDCLAFQKQCNGKIIAKLEVGVGGNGFFKIFEEKDLEKIDLSKKMMLEQFLEGKIYTFDALIDKESNIIDSFCLVYNPLDSVLSGETETAVNVLKEIPEQLNQIGKNCVKEFNCRKEFVHIEFMKTKEGLFYGIDPNLRLCGAYANYLYNIVGTQKIENLWVKVITDQKIEINNPHNSFAGLFARRNSKKYKLSEEELKKELNSSLIHIKYFPQIMSDCLNDIGYFIKADSLEQLEDIKDLIQTYK